MQVCYRHPDRETGRACANCRRPVCLDCLADVGLGGTCEQCRRPPNKPKTVPAGALWKLRSLRTGPLVTYALVATNVAVYVVQTGLGGVLRHNPHFDDGAVSASSVAGGEAWRIVSAGFVHLNAGHLMSNMVVLWFLGTPLEAVVSRLQFLQLYGASLLGGSLGAIVLDPNASSAGASGAIFGLMAGGYVVLGTRGGEGGDFLAPVAGALLVGNLAYTFLQPGLSIGGHLGGAAVGLVAGGAMSEWGPFAKLSFRASTAVLLTLTAVVAGGAVLVAGSA